MVASTRTIGVILFFFLAIQLIFISLPVVTPDEAFYAWKTVTIRENIFTFFSPSIWESHPPFLSLIAAFIPLEPHIALRLISILFGVLALFLMFGLFSRWLEVHVATFATFLMAFHPVFMISSHYGLLDIPLLAGVLLAIDGLDHYVRRRKLGSLVAGGIVSVLVKTKGAAIALPLLLYEFLIRIINIRLPRLRKLTASLIFPIVAGSVAVLGYLVLIFLLQGTISTYSQWEGNVLSFLRLVPWFIWVFFIIGYLGAGSISRGSFLRFWCVWGACMLFFISWTPDYYRFFLRNSFS